MKLTGAKAEQYLTGNNPLALSLFYGENTTKIRQKLQKCAKNIVGEAALEEMRWIEIDPKQLSKEPSQLLDAIKAISFFQGPCAVVIYEIADAQCAILETALSEWKEGDAYIFAQSGSLRKTSKLRKVFETHKNAQVIAFYEDPLTQDQLNHMVRAHGLMLDGEAQALLFDLAANYDELALERFLETLALYQGDKSKLSPEDVEKLMPGLNASAADQIINAMFKGQAKKLIQELRRAEAQGISSQQINILALWRVKMLLSLQSKNNPQQAINTWRPPLFGNRRAEVETNLRVWNMSRLEKALETLIQVEKETRSGRQNLPERAYFERNFLRVAMLAR